MFRFPWTNFHELNLDWIISIFKNAVMSVNGYKPDENGNVEVPQITGVSSVNNINPVDGNVTLGVNDIVGAVKSVNNINPVDGNVTLGAVQAIRAILTDRTDITTLNQYFNTISSVANGIAVGFNVSYTEMTDNAKNNFLPSGVTTGALRFVIIPAPTQLYASLIILYWSGTTRVYFTSGVEWLALQGTRLGTVNTPISEQPNIEGPEIFD